MRMGDGGWGMGDADGAGRRGVPMSITTAEKRQLDEEGFVLLEGFVEPSLLGALRDRVEALFEEEGERAGAEFKQEPQSRRLANLVNKDPAFREVVAIPRLLEY